MKQALEGQKRIRLQIRPIHLLVVAALALPLTTLADEPNDQPAAAAPPIVNIDISPLTQAIQILSNKMVALGFASMSAVDRAMYQFNPSLADAATLNAARTAVAEENTTRDTRQTNAYIQNRFQSIPDSILSVSSGMLQAEAVKKRISNQGKTVKRLTLDTPGSDTLYSNNPQVISARFGSGYDYDLSPPENVDDTVFNMAAVLSPTTYSDQQLKTANTYMAYLTRRYSSPANALSLSKLYDYINQPKDMTERYTRLYQFMTSKPYQDYQLALRSNMAGQSVAVDNLEHLIAERVPSTQTINLDNATDHSLVNPSLLQVKAYTANHRMDDPSWIKNLQQQPAAAVQREIAVELAELLQQNYQAHLDRERMIATLSAIALQNSEAANQALNDNQAKQVNEAIDGLAK